MRQRLTSTDLSIAELLEGGYSFTIPAYQRDYAWTRDEAVQLVDDLIGVMADEEREGSSTPYFLGTMLVVETTGVGTRRKVEVVDGQQRLITLTILLAVLRDLAGAAAEADEIDRLIQRTEGSTEPVCHLRLRPGDEFFFRIAIQSVGASRRGQPAEEIGTSIARGNIEQVRRALRLKLQRELTEAGRRNLFAFLSTNTRVLVVSSDDLDYAYQIFLTINDRGKRLSIEDIFRGEILGPLDPDQRRRYEAIIDEMEKYREEVEPSRTKGKTFFSHLAAIDGWPRRGIIESLKRTVERRGGPRRFVADVFAPMAESYLRIKGADSAAPLADGVRELLLGLRWLELHGDDDWVPAAMVGVAQLLESPDELIRYLGALDRFAHGLMALGCGREARRKYYAPVMKRLAAGEIADPDGLFALSPADQRAMLRNLATRMHLVDAPTAKLALIRADQAVSGLPLESYRPFVERSRRDPERYTVEHICPQGPKEVREPYWLERFPRRGARLRAAHCIGNLVLVTDAQNHRSRQKDFASKKVFLLPDGQVSPFVLTEMLRSEPEWDGAAIARRYGVVMDALKALWRLEGLIPTCPALVGKDLATVEARDAEGEAA